VRAPGRSTIPEPSPGPAGRPRRRRRPHAHDAWRTTPAPDGRTAHGTDEQSAPHPKTRQNAGHSAVTVGMPNRRTFPPPTGLGIIRSRTGIGRNVPALTCARRSSRNSWTPASSTSATARPSTPGDLAPVLPATRCHATISVAGSCTRLNRSSTRPGSAAAQRCSLVCIIPTEARAGTSWTTPRSPTRRGPAGPVLHLSVANDDGSPLALDATATRVNLARAHAAGVTGIRETGSRSSSTSCRAGTNAQRPGAGRTGARR
jgi:hypothetical protein